MDLHKFKLVVGNENESGTNTNLTVITLKQYLEEFDKYCGVKNSSPINLFDQRDEKILVSAQGCFLPVVDTKVEFAVNYYNYQSGSEPGIVVILATAQGTSCQVVVRDSNGNNTILYFNNHGRSHLFEGQRISDYRQSISSSTPSTPSTPFVSLTDEEKMLNSIRIFQVPLKITTRLFNTVKKMCNWDNSIILESCSASSRGMEEAILNLGEEKGPFKGIVDSMGKPYKLERDTTQPIRCTIQFYYCIDTDEITESDVKKIAGQIRKVYDQGHNEGSLVVDYPIPQTGISNPIAIPRPTKTTTPNSKIPAHIIENINFY